MAFEITDVIPRTQKESNETKIEENKDELVESKESTISNQSEGVSNDLFFSCARWHGLSFVFQFLLVLLLLPGVQAHFSKKKIDEAFPGGPGGAQWLGLAWLGAQQAWLGLAWDSQRFARKFNTQKQFCSALRAKV